MCTLFIMDICIIPLILIKTKKQQHWRSWDGERSKTGQRWNSFWRWWRWWWQKWWRRLRRHRKYAEKVRYIARGVLINYITFWDYIFTISDCEICKLFLLSTVIFHNTAGRRNYTISTVAAWWLAFMEWLYGNFYLFCLFWFRFGQSWEFVRVLEVKPMHFSLWCFLDSTLLQEWLHYTHELQHQR